MKQRYEKNSTLTQNQVDSCLYEMKDISLRKATCKKFLTTKYKYSHIN